VENKISNVGAQRRSIDLEWVNLNWGLRSATLIFSIYTVCLVHIDVLYYLSDSLGLIYLQFIFLELRVQGHPESNKTFSCVASIINFRFSNLLSFMLFTKTQISTSMLSCYSVLVLVVNLCIIHRLSGQLVVNVKNKGGDVIQEIIDSNITSDIVTVNFRRGDGTQVTQLIDFVNVGISLH
jgi:hypothetical protein